MKLVLVAAAAALLLLHDVALCESCFQNSSIVIVLKKTNCLGGDGFNAASYRVTR